MVPSNSLQHLGLTKLLIEPNSVQAVHFDLDGLLADTMPVIVASFQQASFDLRGIELERGYLERAAGLNDLSFSAQLRREICADFPYQEVRDLQDKLMWERFDRDGVSLKPGVLELLELLKGYSVPITVGSGGRQDATEHKLRAAGIDQRFDCILGGDGVRRGKPDPHTWLRLKNRLEQFGLVPRNAPRSSHLVFGDAEKDIISARRGQMPSGYVPDIHFDPTVADLASFSFASLKEALKTVESLLLKAA